MTVERSRQLGQALMAASGMTLVLFLIGVGRRSYLVLAIPVFAGLAVVAGLVFWVGYTMASTQEIDDALDLAEVETPETGPLDSETSETGPSETPSETGPSETGLPDSGTSETGGARPPETVAERPLG